MSSEDISAFRHAPVTKLIVLFVISQSIFTAFFNDKPDYRLSLEQLDGFGQVWRIFKTHWVFNSYFTAFLGTWLLFKMREVERRFGSAKYSAYVFISVIGSTLLQLIAIFIGSKFGFNSITSGPYAILFSIMHQYQRIIPPTMYLFGSTFSDTLYILAISTLLTISDSVSSTVPCICGLLMGTIYESSTLLQQWRFPNWIKEISIKFVLPLLFVDNKKKLTTTNTSTSTDQRTENTSSNLRQRQQPTPNINEQDIDALSSMFPGYSRQEIKSALIRSKSNLNRAAEILLTSEPSVGSSQTHL